MSAYPICRCSTRSCTSPSRGASGEGCRSALGTGTRTAPATRTPKSWSPLQHTAAPEAHTPTLPSPSTVATAQECRTPLPPSTPTWGTWGSRLNAVSIILHAAPESSDLIPEVVDAPVQSGQLRAQDNDRSDDDANDPLRISTRHTGTVSRSGSLLHSAAGESCRRNASEPLHPLRRRAAPPRVTSALRLGASRSDAPPSSAPAPHQAPRVRAAPAHDSLYFGCWNVRSW